MTGPHVVNQVFVAAAKWGYAARCGCGWKIAQNTRTAADAAGQRHLRTVHGSAADSLEPLALFALAEVGA